MLYSSKPTVIQAVQLNWANWPEVCDLLGAALSEQKPAWNIPPGEESDSCSEKGDGPGFIALNVTTMHGEIAVVRHGDYIIPDGKPGTFYPCKPEVFEAKYKEFAGNDFAWALEQLEAGKKVARAHWGGYWRSESATVNFRGAEGFDFACVVAYLKEGGMAPAQPYWLDILATDWGVVD